MRFSSRLLALVICLLMIVTVLPVGVFAEETVLEETETSPEEHVKFCGVQTGVDDASVRIVFGVDGLGYSKAGVKVERLIGGDGWVVGDMELTKTREVFTSILADGDSVSAEELGVEYIAMVAITNIDSEGAIRLTPYVKVVDGEEIFGEPRIYAVDFVGEDLVLTMSTESYTQDFTEFAPGSAGRDTWEQQSQPSSDNSWGGEGARTMVHDEENGWAKWVGGPMKQYRSATKPDSRVSDTASALKFGDETAVPYWTQSERLKFTKTIPYDLKDYLGKTIVITAMIRVDEIGKYNTDADGQSVTVYLDGDGKVVDAGTEGATEKTYYGYKETVLTGADAKVTVTFGFYDEFDTSPITGASARYTLKADGEWVEISSSMAVTQTLIESLQPVKDADGVYHPSAVRPSISAGGSSAYIRTAYFDYVTCTIVPTIHDVCTDFVDVSVEATCTVDGYTGKACAVCNKLDEDTLVVTRAEGHKSNEVTDPCTQDSYCTVCGEMLHKAEGHTNVEYVAPTISTDGYIRGTCGECGEVFDETLARGLYEDFENLDGFQFTNNAWNTLSGLASDDIKIQNGSDSWATKSELVTEENGNTYWYKNTSTTNGFYIMDVSEDEILSGAIVELSFRYQMISGTSNCSIIGMKTSGTQGATDGTETRILCAWGGYIKSGTDYGTYITEKVSGNGQWYDLRAVVDTTTYNYKVWLGDELVTVTDYANNRIYYKGTDGKWIYQAGSKDTKNPYNIADDAAFTSFYLFHFNNSMKIGLDDIKLAILDSMPAGDIPTDATAKE